MIAVGGSPVMARPGGVVIASGPGPVAMAAPAITQIVLPPRGTMVTAVVVVVPGHPAPFQYPPCDPYGDAQAIRAALKGNPLHTDGRTLINILCNRSLNQLEVISAVYQNLFGHALKHGIKHETMGNFRKILCRRFRPPLEIKARALYKAVHNKGVVAVNDGRLIDICAFTPNCEWPALKAITRQATGQDFANLVNRHTTNIGDFKTGLDILIQGARDENPIVNTVTVAQDVTLLFRASDARKIGHDTESFISVLCRHAPWYNVGVNTAYQAQFKHDVRHAVDKTSMTSNTKHLLRALCLTPYEYFADRLYFAMKGAGTDDFTMIYFLTYLERNELQQIAAILKQRHPSHDMYKMIKSDLSGDYQHAALALFGQPF